MDAEFIDAVMSNDVSPERRAELRERLMLIWVGLERIKPKKRLAYVLRVVDGLSLEETAELVGTNVATVAKRVKHAERELGVYLKRRGDQNDDRGLS